MDVHMLDALLGGHMIRKLALVSMLALASAPLMAAECTTVVEGTDQMTYNVKEINISKACKEFTIELHHTGKLAKNVMGHNLVISKTDDMNAIAQEGIAAGVDKDYLVADDSRILAHAPLIGGGETSKVTFDVSKLKAEDKHEFFCTFPGHFAMMKGAVNLVD